MDREEARALLPMVNNLEFMDMLKYYSNVRIKLLLKNLETIEDVMAMKQAQARIAELRRNETLRDEVIEKAK